MAHGIADRQFNTETIYAYNGELIYKLCLRCTYMNMYVTHQQIVIRLYYARNPWIYLIHCLEPSRDITFRVYLNQSAKRV
jgi:hypothetical protein